MLQLLSHRLTECARRLRALRLSVGHQPGADREGTYTCEVYESSGGEFTLHDCYGYEVKSVRA